MSFDNDIPSAPFPSARLVNLLDFTRTVLKKEGVVEVQLLASAGVPTRTWNPAHTQGQQEGTLPLGT